MIYLGNNYLNYIYNMWLDDEFCLDNIYLYFSFPFQTFETCFVKYVNKGMETYCL